MTRSVRGKLALSYALVIVITGGLLLVVVAVFLLRYVPEGPIATNTGFVPNRGDLIAAFAPRAAAVFGVLVVLGAVVGWFLAGRMLRPLDRITAVTREVGKGSLADRVPVHGDDEFAELAAAFNDMLRRIEHQIEEQRRFAANASHELRTPLAASQAVIDASLHDERRPEARAVLDKLRSVNGRAIELTESLLMLSRVEHPLELSGAVDLSLAAEEAQESLLPLAESRGVEVTVSGDIAMARGSDALLGQLVTNLVHNAIVHNHPGGSVAVTVSGRTGRTHVRVENTGALFDAEVVATLVEPFQRGGRARSSHDGAGLGLAIVDRIVAGHDGELRITPRDEGGLNVEVSLPEA